VAVKSFMSARSSDLMTRPRNPALPSVIPHPPGRWKTRGQRERFQLKFLAGLQTSVQLLPLEMRSR